MVRARSRRTVATAAVLLGVLAAIPSELASAGTRAASGGSQQLATGSFAVVPTTVSTPVPGPLVLTYPAILSPGPQYFDAVNTGTTTLTSAGYGVVVAGGGLGDPSITLTACPGGTWNPGSGACSTAAVAIGTWSGGSSAPVTSSSVPAVPGARLAMKASVSAGGVLSLVTTATISITASSGPTRNVRSATSTDS